MINEDWEHKEFIPGGYYIGGTDDKVTYDTLSEYGQAADGARARVLAMECLSAVPRGSGEQAKSPGSPQVGWFFQDEKGLSDVKASPEWDTSNSFLFSFPLADGAVDALAPYNTAALNYDSFYPTEEVFAKAESDPSGFFSSNMDSSGYKMVLVSDSYFWGPELKNDNLNGYKVRVTYEHMMRFWCCSAKTVADVQSPDPRVVLYRPNDRGIVGLKYILGDLVGESGVSGKAYELTNVPDEQQMTYVRVTVEKQDVRKDGKTSAGWTPLTFRDYWEGPEMVEEDTESAAPVEAMLTITVPGNNLEKWYNEENVVDAKTNEKVPKTRLMLEIGNTNDSNVNVLTFTNPLLAGYTASVGGQERHFLVTGNSSSITIDPADSTEPVLVMPGAKEVNRRVAANKAFTGITFKLDPEVDSFLQYDGAKITTIKLVKGPAGSDVATAEINGTKYGEVLGG
jgi:hypothetical protein